MVEHSSNKTIAKNTLLLYIRMMVTMFISLFTSRVILQTLGVEDYGLYQAVGGIVGFMSFLNSALSAGTGRFLTFGLGKGDKLELQRTFSTVLEVHIVLALLIIIIAETGGLWFLYNKMVIPAERFDAALWVFHISIVTAAINITQVPYTASITSHEKFNLYAYVSIFEAVAKLIIVYMLYIGNYDKLILYAVLLFLLQSGLRMFYRWYCNNKFEECRLIWCFDKKIFAPIAKYSGWNLFANITIALNNQGVLLLLNMYFSPAVVAARAISLQVDGIVKQFVNNFKTASNPQIIKRYAAGDVEGSKKLLFQTSNLAFFLMLVIIMPILTVTEPLLKLWLGIIPEYTVIFLQLILIQNLFSVFDSCFYQAFAAAGRLKENALVSPVLNGIRFVIIYILFKYGYSPVCLSYAGIFTNIVISCIAKPYLMVRCFNYRWSDFYNVFIPCTKVLLPMAIVVYMMNYCISEDFRNSFVGVLMLGGVCFVIACSIVFWGGLSNDDRKKIQAMILSKVKMAR